MDRTGAGVRQRGLFRLFSFAAIALAAAWAAGGLAPGGEVVLELVEGHPACCVLSTRRAKARQMLARTSRTSTVLKVTPGMSPTG